jgi:phosphopantetheinyl transferase
MPANAPPASLAPPEPAGTPIAALGARLRREGAVWFLANLARLPADLAPVLPEEEAEAERLPPGLARAGRLARRRLARHVAAEATGEKARDLRIGADAMGKPFFFGGAAAYHLSFSARGTLALIGLADQPLGVDLEIAEPGLAIPFNMLRAEECARLMAEPEAERISAFCRIWAAKEAIVKAVGLGFRIAPERILLPEQGERLVDIRILPNPAGNAGENPAASGPPVLTGAGIHVFVSRINGEAEEPARRIGIVAARATGASPADPKEP